MSAGRIGTEPTPQPSMLGRAFADLARAFWGVTRDLLRLAMLTVLILFALYVAAFIAHAGLTMLDAGWKAV